MIKAEKMAVEFEGKANELLAECAVALTAITRAVSNGDAEIAEASIYSVFIATARELHRKGIDIDTWIVGNQIAKATLK